MIGLTKTTKGRMGNRLFEYHFLRQIAKKTNLGYFHSALKDRNYIEKMYREPRGLKECFKKKESFSSREILAMGQAKFIDHIISEPSKSFLLKTPLLGELFFDFLFYDPNEFIRIKDEFRSELLENLKNKFIIALHFRGTDFATWNINASLKKDYYLRAIEYCLEFFKDKNIGIMVFTDDIKFEPYLETKKYLESSQKQIPIYFGDPNGLPIKDLWYMSQSDVLISSPSTFSIWGGILGKKKKIIHDTGWLNYAVEQNDLFWVKLRCTTNPFYSLWKEF